MLFTLFVINKSGGLIYTRDLNPVARLAGGNEYMMTASTFHSLHAIAKTLAPVRSGGIEVVDAPAFSLHCFETPTGLKFFVTARTRAPAGAGGPGAPPLSPPPPPGVAGVTPPGEVNAFLRRVYELYADYVLKNPFYELEMPIRTRLFDAAVESAVRSAGLGTGAGGDFAPPGAGGASKVGAPGAAGGGAPAPMFSGTATG